MALFKVTRDDISPSLSRLARTAKNPVAVLRAMGTTFKSITEGNFSSFGAAYRPKPWPPLRDPEGKPSILQKSTTLAKAFHLEVTAHAATLSNPMPYAGIHQFGGIIRAKGKALSWVNSKGERVFAKMVTIPARPFFPVLNGQLTPKAEEKIGNAARRVIEREAAG
jgi:phage gpG-like protein